MNPSGYCMCGCGKRTLRARKTNNRLGHRRGEPLHFVKGHGGVAGVHAQTGSLNWENAKWADGSKVAAWIDSKVAVERIAACDLSNELSSLRKACTASFWRLDRIMTRLGLHVAQLPDEVWVAHRQAVKR